MSAAYDFIALHSMLDICKEYKCVKISCDYCKDNLAINFANYTCTLCDTANTALSVQLSDPSVNYTLCTFHELQAFQ